MKPCVQPSPGGPAEPAFHSKKAFSGQPSGDNSRFFSKGNLVLRISHFEAAGT